MCIRDRLVKSSGWEDIRYIHNEKPLGHIFNWNKSLSEAQGEYIKIMFSDDWFTAPDSLEKMVSLLDRSPEASLAFCGTMQVMLPEDEPVSYTHLAVVFDGQEALESFLMVVYTISS